MPISPFARAAVLATAVASLTVLAGPGRTQTDTFSGLRALNFARNYVVKLNGGLGVYRPAACMFSREWGNSGCLVSGDAEGFRFRFLGGPPGWERLGKPATFETEILIAPDGRSVLQVPYNGAPRQAASGGGATGPGMEPPTQTPVEPPADTPPPPTL